MNANFAATLVAGVDPMLADVAIQLQAAPLPLAPVGTKAVELDFDGGGLSSDAGVVLLKDIDDQLGLTVLSQLCCRTCAMRVVSTLPQKTCSNNACFKLPQAMKMLTTPTRSATISSSNCGSIACLKPARLAHNRRSHGLKTHLTHRTLPHGAGVAGAIYRLLCQGTHGIVLDVDDTEDRVHGQQEHARYDGYYGGYCFLPLHLYEGLSGCLLTTIFKATRFSGSQMLSVLKRVVKRLRHAWPNTLVIFRGDSHFAYPEVMQWIDEQPELSYVTGLTSNAILNKLAREVVEQAKRASRLQGAQGHPLSLNALPGRNVVTRAPGSHQGRGLRARR